VKVLISLFSLMTISPFSLEDELKKKTNRQKETNGFQVVNIGEQTTLATKSMILQVVMTNVVKKDM
jgi:hypothetical protein